jgi:hypothetical protein
MRRTAPAATEEERALAGEIATVLEDYGDALFGGTAFVQHLPGNLIGPHKNAAAGLMVSVKGTLYAVLVVKP